MPRSCRNSLRHQSWPGGRQCGTANGAPAESYRDDGNRWLFHNVNEGWHLPPREPYAPVLTGGPVVDAAWPRLLARPPAWPAPTLVADPDLHLLVVTRRSRQPRSNPSGIGLVSSRDARLARRAGGHELARHHGD